MSENLYPNIARVEALPPWDGKAPKGLDRPRRIVELLGNPQDRVPAIHITGTNGKGSVSALVSACLLADGKRVGQFLSPHLHSINERLLVNGSPVSLARLDRAFAEVGAIEESVGERLSYFEAVIVASHLIAAQDQFDFQVVEVGLGGRLDATNLMKAPLVTAITSIGLEHCEVLGPTEAHIAREKAGIFRPESPAVIGPVSPQARGAIEEVSVAKELHFFGEAFSLREEHLLVARDGWEFSLPVKERSLRARYQRENFAVAGYIAHLLGIEDEKIREGMLRMNWPGRLEEHLLDGRRVLLDGAHNPDGVRGLLSYLEGEKVSFIISILPRKDFQQMGKIFREWKEEHELFFVSMESHESVAPERLCEAFGGGHVCRSFAEAFSQCQNPLTVVTGSLYFLGEVRAHLGLGPVSTFRG